MLNIIFSLFVFANGMGSPPPKKTFNPNEYCYLVDMIDYDTVNEAIDCLSKNKSLKLYLDSQGGIVQAGELLIDYVNKNNTTVFCDMCYSMAANIWLNAKNREAYKDSDFMMHYIWTIIRGPMTIKTLRQLADRLENETEGFLDCLESSQKSYFILKMRQGDFFFTTKTLDLLYLDYTMLRMP